MQDSLIIGVVTYNAEKFVHFFTSIVATLPKNWKMVVLDNCSQDNTCSLLKSHYPAVEIINSSTNLGFGKGNNIILRKAVRENVDYVFLLNQDASIRKRDIEKLMRVNKKHKKIYITSPVHLNGKADELDIAFSQYQLPERCPLLYLDALRKNKMRRFYYTSYVNAAGWLLSRECLLKIGGFNPLFMLYGEDDDFMNRVKFHNAKIAIVPDAYLLHARETRSDVVTTAINPKNSQEFFRYLIRQLDINAPMQGISKIATKQVAQCIMF